MLRKRIAIIIVLAAGLAAGLSAEAAETLDADAAVQLALKNNLSLQRTKLAADAAKRASDRSWNSLIPTATASTTRTLPNEAAVGDPEWTTRNALSLSLSLSPSIVSEMKQAKLEYESGLIDYDQARRSLELATRKAFAQLLLYEANIDIAERKIETARSRYEQTAAKAKVGQASQLDALSAQVDWETLKPSLSAAETAYADALDEFRTLLGLPADRDLALAGTLEAGIDSSALAAERVGESAEVAALRKSVEVAAAGKKTVRDSALLPSLTLSYTEAPTYSAETWSDAGSFSVSLGLKLDGFLPWSSTREAMDQYDDTVATLNSRIAEAELTSDATIRQLRRSVEKSFGSLEALSLNVRLAEQSYAMYEEAYRKGTSDLQSLKSAGDTLEEARLSVLKERYTLAVALLDLENELNVPFGSIGKR